ncbi:hypothetical protein AAFP30_16470 [Gordonia sp. CPCC 205515]|uniref:hypothetical protein n=1 Tax=Gordonia sp. CPCC 205515 TaxID=3140791 RepID=UPI003AF3550A
MAANARPPRRKSSRPVTRRVAGRPHPGAPVDGAPDPVDGAPDPVDSAQDPVDSAQDRVDSAPDRVDSAPDRVDGAQDRVDSAPDPVDGARDSVDSAQSTGNDAHSTDVIQPDVQTDPVETDVVQTDVVETDTVETGETAVDMTKPTGKTRPVARVSTLRPGNEAPAQSAAGGASKIDTAGKPGRSWSGFGNTTLYVLGGVAAVLALFALIAGLHPGAKIGPNKAFIDQAGTTELTSQASTKLCQANSADATTEQNFDAWSGKTKTVLTGKALEQFNELIKAQKDALTQAKAKNDCRMDALGVQNMSGSDDGATAQLVATMIVSGSQNGIATQSISPRYQVNMVKHGDQWLIAEVLDL